MRRTHELVYLFKCWLCFSPHCSPNEREDSPCPVGWGGHRGHRGSRIDGRPNGAGTSGTVYRARLHRSPASSSRRLWQVGATSPVLMRSIIRNTWLNSRVCRPSTQEHRSVQRGIFSPYRLRGRRRRYQELHQRGPHYVARGSERLVSLSAELLTTSGDTQIQKTPQYNHFHTLLTVWAYIPTLDGKISQKSTCPFHLRCMCDFI